MTMRTMGVLCLVICAGAFGCGSETEVNGTVNGHALAASDAVFVEEGDETTPTRRVIVSDVDDVCAALRDGSSLGTSLEIRIVGLGGDDAEFDVVSGTAEPPFATATFEADGEATSAASGNVTTGSSDDQTLEADFDLDFGESGALDGSVGAARCDPDAG